MYWMVYQTMAGDAIRLVLGQIDYSLKSISLCYKYLLVENQWKVSRMMMTIPTNLENQKKENVPKLS